MDNQLATLQSLDPATKAEAERLYWAREFERCGDDLMHLATRYLQVRGKESIKMFPLRYLQSSGHPDR